MIFVVDRLVNYLIYIFLIHFCWRIHFRKKIWCIASSVAISVVSGIIANIYGDSLIFYLLCSVVAMLLLFEYKIPNLILITLGLTWFMGMMDTYSLNILRILTGKYARTETIEWWQLTAYLISFAIEFCMYYFVLKRNGVYLKSLKKRYLVGLLLLTLIFELVVTYVFSVLYGSINEYEWYFHIRFALCLIGAIYSIYITLQLAVSNYQYEKQNNQLAKALKIQQDQYQYQKDTNQNLRKFRHDLINHIGAMQELLAKEQYDNAKDYIEKTWKVTESLTTKINTGDDYVDAILNYYAYRCEKKDIDFSLTGKLIRPLDIDVLDCTTLLGNSLQNALETAEKLGAGFVKVELIDHADEVFISVYNSCQDKEFSSVTDIETTKPDKKNHGFGLKNIASIVDKYEGEYYITVDKAPAGNVFKLDISLPRRG